MTPFLSANVNSCSNDTNSSSAMLQPALGIATCVRKLKCRRSAIQVLTSTAIGEFNGVSKIGSAVVALISVSGLVVSYEFRVYVDSRDVINDAADL